MKYFRLLLSCLLLMAIAQAEGTRIWQQTKYDEFEKGTAHGVAISSNGSLSLAPSFTALYTSPSLICGTWRPMPTATYMPRRARRRGSTDHA